ncbi:MAG: hypothetical protein WKF80_01735 [Thermomicrobiales bacterium]
MTTLLSWLLTAQSAGATALALALAVMVARVAPVPFLRSRRDAVTLHTYLVSTPYRIRRQRMPLVVLALVAVGEVGLGVVPSWELVVALLTAVVILVVPVRCVLSTEGVRIGWLPVRRWTEFGGLRVRRGTIHLQPISGSSGFEFPLRGRFEDGDLVAEVRGMITRAYKGAAMGDHTPEAQTSGDSVEDASYVALVIAH